MRAATVCQRDTPGTAAPKNDRPKSGVPNPPAENGQNGGWAIALVGGWGEVGPPDSEWGQTLRAASVCLRDTPGTAAPTNDRPKSNFPKPPAENSPYEGCAIAFLGGVGRSWSAGLGMGPNFSSGFRVPAACPGYSRGQKGAPEGPRHKPLAEKGQNGRWVIALVGRGAKLVRRTRNGAKLCERPPCARGMPRAQPRPKKSARRPPSQNSLRKMAQTRGVL